MLPCCLGIPKEFGRVALGGSGLPIAIWAGDRCIRESLPGSQKRVTTCLCNQSNPEMRAEIAKTHILHYSWFSGEQWLLRTCTLQSCSSQVIDYSLCFSEPNFGRTKRDVPRPFISLRQEKKKARPLRNAIIVIPVFEHQLNSCNSVIL